MEYLIALVALTVMEIVLGIDNIVFIALITGQLPAEQRPRARQLGLGLALGMRILLLLSLSWLMRLTQPLFQLDWLPLPPAWLTEEVIDVSCKDLILFFGGLFLIYKSVTEIHKRIEGGGEHHAVEGKVSFGGVLFQIALLDVIFSLDSVITAVGMVKAEGDRFLMGLAVMIAAIVTAVVVMLIFAGRVSDFIERHPTLKMLALAFLILIGVMLVAEGVGTHFNKGYIYFAMAFSLLVEALNMRVRTAKVNKAAAGEGG